jgi:hypothetical protein
MSFVTKVGDQYLVTVVYLPASNEIRSASFAVATSQPVEIFWNLVTVGASINQETATFAEEPLVTPDNGFVNIRSITPTQLVAQLQPPSLKVSHALHYVLRIKHPSSPNVLEHDPSIMISEDPIEIP